MGTLLKNIEIKIGGKDYDQDYNYLNIVLEQKLLKPNLLSFTMQKKLLHDRLDDYNFPLLKQLIGEKVTLKIVTIRFDEKDREVGNETLEFKGNIFHVNIRRRSNMFSEQLYDVQACSPDYLLIDHPHCFSYEDMKLKDIVSKTLNPYQIPNEIDPRTTGSIPYTVQYNESNYQFLTRLAAHYGEWMYNDGVKWFFGKLKKKDKVRLDPRNDILNYSFQVDLMHHKLQHAHHDYLKYENPSQSDSDFSELTRSGYHELTDVAKNKSASLFTKETFQHLQCSNPEENDLDELEISAKAQLFGEKTQQVVCTGASVRADLTIGSVIEIVDHFYDDDTSFTNTPHDKLLITSIIHSAEMKGEYSNEFIAYPANSEYPPYYQSDIYPRAAAQRAKVTDNNDPKKLGRIRVQFLWQEEQDKNLKTPWIRIAQPHGGDDKGFYFIPEIKEEVMVDFENSNAEKPYVTGTLWHGKQLPGEKWPTKNNDIKAIRTRNGHTIEIHDEGDDGFIRIYDHEKENYILTFSTDDKLIKLESTGNIELYAKSDIIMEAGNDLKINVGNNRKVEIKNDDTLDVWGKQKIKIEGKKDEDVHGTGKLQVIGNLHIGSNSNLNCQAVATLDLKGNITNIKGDASMSLKAPIVKIN